VITEDERDILLSCARALTQYVEPERVYTPRQPMTTDGTRPGDLFTAQVSWEDILLPHGWRVVGHRGEVTLWRRPGKGHRLSATTGWNGTDLLYVFTTNAPPFEAERGYSKFTAYTLLHATGDLHKAATLLACQGYVSRHEGPGVSGIRTTRGRPAIRTVKGGEVPSWRS
jgi:hypothetical protein